MGGGAACPHYELLATGGHSYESWTTLQATEEGMLEREYQALQPLNKKIDRVHPARRNRLNAVEFVHDVLGEMKREDVNSDEEQESEGTVSNGS